MEWMATGLSPRVRGNRYEVGVVVQKPGTIPACTGEPATLDSQNPRGGDYPRVYGGTVPMSGN